MLANIAKSQEDNMSKTTDERDKIAAVQKAAVTSFCQRMLMLAVAGAVFVFMLSFIWLFPNKVKYS